VPYSYLRAIGTFAWLRRMSESRLRVSWGQARAWRRVKVPKQKGRIAFLQEMNSVGGKESALPDIGLKFVLRERQQKNVSRNLCKMWIKSNTHKTQQGQHNTRQDTNNTTHDDTKKGWPGRRKENSINRIWILKSYHKGERYIYIGLTLTPAKHVNRNLCKNWIRSDTQKPQ